MPGLTNRGKRRIAEVGWPNVVASVALYKATATPSDLTNVLADLTGEITNAAYARTAVTGQAVVEDDTNHRAAITATNVTFGSIVAGDVPGFAIIFEAGANDGARNVIAWAEITGSAPDGTPYTVAWDSTGIARLT